MFRACGKCGRAFCLTHFVRATGNCLGCADRCSFRHCEMLTSSRCKRCGASLCASHRHKAGTRCQTCERWFRDELAKLQQEDKRSDGKDRRDTKLGTVMHLSMWALVGLSSLGGVGILAGGAALMVLFGIGLAIRSGGPGRLKGKTRRRFLAERPPTLLGS